MRPHFFVRRLRFENGERTSVVVRLDADLPDHAAAGWMPLASRLGIDQEQEDVLLAAIDPDSSANPWKDPFVRLRNFLIVVLYLAAGIRRCELVGMQVGDLSVWWPETIIYHRDHEPIDRHPRQPVVIETAGLEATLGIAVIQRLSSYLEARRKRDPVGNIAQLWIRNGGSAALTEGDIGRIFNDIRKACSRTPARGSGGTGKT
ncbi:MULTISPECIES: hypothetical protein [Ramlibacter]|uniref:Tyr recombinase domain-containing protein n=1 Tax=Ramlibacter pinisoli TaxID=2682844 RepID=A0A6N8IMK8_9BURK|nr:MULTISPECIES: hypothetical protein [Ramlibacter]MBA2960694.1 hypothetical protein [Ramlibacter sp. CGMCC 1.13660]MVQ28024.1 hypothetical protein [Ramlibacter pinisoli]